MIIKTRVAYFLGNPLFYLLVWTTNKISESAIKFGKAASKISKSAIKSSKSAIKPQYFQYQLRYFTTKTVKKLILSKRKLAISY
ncbi:hypothetical protein AN960_23385 [Bacillus sp. FJAT-25509]|nr:hypothetical protein AN960_23385 [Bacillus sp. FJAT-25509]